MDRRKFMAGCLGGYLGLPLLAGEAQAQAGLSKIIFPFAAGAGGDTLCRLIGQETRELAANTAFWQPVVRATGYKIEN